MKTVIFLVLTGCLIACTSKNFIDVKVYSNNSQIDSLYIVESMSGKILFRIPIQNKIEEEIQGVIAYPTTGSIQTKDGKHSYLVILHPDREWNITVKADSSIRTKNLGDSLLNYLWTSNNEFITQYAGYVFTSSDTDSIVRLCQNFEESGRLEIEKRSSNLSLEEKELLLYQNSARIHSFMFYYGRLAEDFPASHKYFSFIKQIDNNTRWTKTLPHNLLYKHEINYLLLYDSIVSNESFLNYVASQTEDKDLSDYLKAAYITQIISTPSYWRKHSKLLNAEVLKDLVDQEVSNKYYDLIIKPSNSFFSSQKGVVAYDFVAESIDGSKVKLSDFRGQVVFIDSWASWCGPCIAHRPRVLELARKYAANDSVKVLMISMDANRNDWVRYLTRKNQLDVEGDLIIVNGMKTNYGDHFNVRQIPRYILIDKDGIIVNSDIPEPSIAVEKMIDYELSSW